MLKRFWARIQRRWRINAAKALRAPLREFVYLDDVSVYSLLASRIGPLAAEFTDTQTTSLRNEIAGSVSGNTGLVKGDVSSRLEDTQTQTSQVLRKSTVQVAFKDLIELEEGRLAIQLPALETKPPAVRTWADLEKLIGEPLLDNWVIEPATLNRGQLVEFEVELDADSIFRITSMISAMLSIIQENPEVFKSLSGMLEATAVNRILDKLLVGLIPVRGKALDYQVVDLNGKELLLHRRMLDQLRGDGSRPSHPLQVVGVTEQRLYWKDIRRVLFSRSRYRVMCRLGRDGLQDAWVPVKLLDVLGAVLPDLCTPS